MLYGGELRLLGGSQDVTVEISYLLLQVFQRPFPLRMLLNVHLDEESAIVKCLGRTCVH